jgi:5-methyltetrahydrofolate--homocysteine methyltransferase
MTEPRRTRRLPDGTRSGVPGRVDAGPGLLEPVDPAVFPGLEARRQVDGGVSSARWWALLDEGAPILADGAMGTMLFLSGLQFGDPPEVWNLTQPDVVRRIHRGYLEAGSRILLTNTFGGNRLRLGLHRLEARVAELNQTAAILLRSEVEAAGGRALVAGDIGPSGAIMAPMGTLDYREAVDVFAEQAAALVAGGVDLIWIETMSDLTEIKAAIEGVRQVAPGIPLITTMTFDTRGRTMMGVTPEQAVEALAAWGSDAIGGNCGNGPDEILPVISRMRAVVPDAFLVAKSNAGMPELVDMRAVYRASPGTMAAAAAEMRAAGAQIVGACCGSTPDHLRAMGAALVTAARTDS